MRKIFLLLGLLVCFSGLSQNPDYHRFGARSKYFQPDTLSTFDRDALTPKLGTIMYHKDTGISQWEQWDGSDWKTFGEGISRDSLIVQSPDSFGTLSNYWIGTEAQMDAVILIDPNYFDNVLWFCTDCTEVVEVDWGNINGNIDNQADLIARLDLKLNASSYTAADVLSKLLTVDGSGSELDADLLRGVHWGNVDTDIVTSGDIYSGGYKVPVLENAEANIDQLTLLSGNIFNDGGLRIRNRTTLQSTIMWMDDSNYFHMWNGGTGNRPVKINVGGGGNGGLEVGGNGEFTGTVSGSDPVNSDDFVTKGYGESNFATVTTGTFSPTLIDEGGGATYSFSCNGSCNYTKIGNQVILQVPLTSINTTGSFTGDLKLGNLPYTIASLSSGSIRISGISTSFYSLVAVTDANNDEIEFYYQNALDGNMNQEIGGNFTNGNLELTITYRTTD